MPVTPETSTDPTIAGMETAVGQPLKKCTRYELNRPSPMPIAPPIRHSRIASTRNCQRISRLRAPTELQGDFDAYVKLIGDTLTVETKLVAAAKRGDTSQLRRQILEQQALRPRLSAAARKIGFKVCSQGAG